MGSMAVIVKVLSMLAINKVLAIYVGPAGYAVIGQFQNAITGLAALASGGVGTGVTKYTAEYNFDSKKQNLLWSTAGIGCVVGSFFVAFLIIIFHAPLSDIFLKSEAYSSAIICAGIFLPLLVLNILLLAILNGKKEIKIFVAANIFNSLSSLFAVVLGVWVLGLEGALIGLTVGQSMACIFTLWKLRKLPWAKYKYIQLAFDWNLGKLLGSFTLMALATSIVGPLAQIIVRNSLIENLGFISAGYWEAVSRVSGALIMLITTPLSIYYLPRIAELQNKEELKREIISTYKLLMPTAFVAGLAIFLLRDSVILLMFSKEFYPMNILFKPQLIGDILRIAAWLLSFYLLAKARTKQFIATEVIFSLSFIPISWLAISELGLIGVSIAYAVNNTAYLLAMIIIVYRDLNRYKYENYIFNNDI
jgi:PST family polysaccharide transporter